MLSPDTHHNGYCQKDNMKRVLARMWRKENPSVLLRGMQTGATFIEYSVEIPQKVKIELPCDPAVSILGIY